MAEQSKTIFITGAGSGIGLAAARRFLQSGWNVAALDVSGERLRESFPDESSQLLRIAGDTRDGETLAMTAGDIAERYGAINAVFANAGIHQVSSLETITDADLDAIIGVNIKGTINTLRAAATRLRDGGRVVNFSSSVVGLYQPTYGVYAATKAAVEALTRVFAKEMGKRRITVNAVAPGPTATGLFLEDKDEKTVARIAAMNPLGRLGEPADIASVASPEAAEPSAAMPLASRATRSVSSAAVRVVSTACTC